MGDELQSMALIALGFFALGNLSGIISIGALLTEDAEHFSISGETAPPPNPDTAKWSPRIVEGLDQQRQEINGRSRKLHVAGWPTRLIKFLSHYRFDVEVMLEDIEEKQRDFDRINAVIEYGDTVERTDNETYWRARDNYGSHSDAMSALGSQSESIDVEITEIEDAIDILTEIEKPNPDPQVIEWCVSWGGVSDELKDKINQAV